MIPAENLVVFSSNKKTSSAVFPLFAKKARSSLDIKLVKFVYTKTHLAINFLQKNILVKS